MQAEWAGASDSKLPIFPTQPGVGNGQLSSVEGACGTGQPSPDDCLHNLKGLAPWPRESAGVQDGRAHTQPSYCPAFGFSSPVAWVPHPMPAQHCLFPFLVQTWR